MKAVKLPPAARTAVLRDERPAEGRRYWLGAGQYNPPTVCLQSAARPSRRPGPSVAARRGEARRGAALDGLGAD